MKLTKFENNKVNFDEFEADMSPDKSLETLIPPGVE